MSNMRRKTRIIARSFLTIGMALPIIGLMVGGNKGFAVAAMVVAVLSMVAIASTVYVCAKEPQ